MRIAYLVDSVDYVRGNCFQHQLYATMRDVANVEIVELQHLLSRKTKFDGIVSVLKQRTLFNNINKLRPIIGDTPLVIYDQDPWESFIDSSQYKDAYFHFTQAFNVTAIAVTTKFWADHLRKVGLPGVFVKMWMLQKYCDVGTPFINRTIDVAFIGRLHPYRKRLFDELTHQGINVTYIPGTFKYNDFLRLLSNVRIFVHSEDSSIMVDGETFNLNVGLWIKDIEAAARGAFSIRNNAEGADTYVDGIDTIRLFDDVHDVCSMIDDIHKMDETYRQTLLNTTVSKIKNANYWPNTATILIEQLGT
jgi:hypothetical protein